MNFTFISSDYRKWHECQCVETTATITGWARCGDLCLSGADLARHIAVSLENRNVQDVLNSLNGNFALVCMNSGKIVLAVDHIRSIPLFFRKDDQSIIISDDVRKVVPDSFDYDPDSIAEFATAGMVTGDNTFYSGIKGLRAGQYLECSSECQAQFYYEYRCTYDRSCDSAKEFDDLCLNMDRAVMGAFERVVSCLEGRQVVVPLSGGLDSRLVAASLLRAGHDNVLCFSYGLPGNFEAEISRRIATKLGCPWVFIEYSPDMLRQSMSDPLMIDYLGMAGNGVSMPHSDDWCAIRQLKEKGLIAEDAVFMPGHTGDFICGSHLKYLLDPTYNNDPTDLRSALTDKHYSLWEDLLRCKPARTAIDRRMDAYLDIARDQAHLAATYELWEWHERQAKFIINAVRAYEFFGFDWRLPLWDREFMDFWKGVPIEFKVNKHLYLSALVRHDPLGVFAGKTPPPAWDRNLVLASMSEKGDRLKYRLKARLETVPCIHRAIVRRRRRRKHRKGFERHPLGFPKAFGRKRYIGQELDKRHHLSLLVKDYMRDVHGTSWRRMKKIVSN